MTDRGRSSDKAAVGTARRGSYTDYGCLYFAVVFENGHQDVVLWKIISVCVSDKAHFVLSFSIPFAGLMDGVRKCL